MAQEKGKAANDRPALAVVAALAGWFVPGLGHLLLRKWARALVYFLAVGALAITGLALRGNIFSGSSGDAFDMLGFLADLGTGVFYFVSKLAHPGGPDVGAGVLYFVSKFVPNGGPDVSRAAGDYGTRFFATAGVLNLLCVLEAHEIARGRKT